MITTYPGSNLTNLAIGVVFAGVVYLVQVMAEASEVRDYEGGRECLDQHLQVFTDDAGGMKTPTVRLQYYNSGNMCSTAA